MKKNYKAARECLQVGDVPNTIVYPSAEHSKEDNAPTMIIRVDSQRRHITPVVNTKNKVEHIKNPDDTEELLDQINDKASSLTISNNSCKYIYCGAANGFINAIGQTARILSVATLGGTNITTVPTIIENNVS